MPCLKSLIMMVLSPPPPHSYLPSSLWFCLSRLGNGILSAQELNNSFSQMIIEWRRRDERMKQDKRHQHHHNRHAVVHQHKAFHQPSPSLEAIPIPFTKADFERAIVKISEGIVSYLEQNTAITTEILLPVPDGNISERYGRKVLKEQLNVRLTRPEMRCLCMKLRGELSSSSSPSPSSSVLSRSPSFSPSHHLPSLSPSSISSSSSSLSSFHEERSRPNAETKQTRSKKLQKRSCSSSSEGESDEQGNSSTDQQTTSSSSSEDPMISGKALKTLLINLRNMIVKKRLGHIPLLPVINAKS
jgi:hypothetical protein